MSRANAWRSYLSLTAKEVLGISGRMRCHSWRASCDFVDVVTGSESQQPLRFGYVSVATRQIRQSAHTYGIHLRGKKFSAGRPSTCLFLLADSVKCLSPSYEAGVCHITLQASLLSQEDASDASIAVAFHLHDQAPLLGFAGRTHLLSFGPSSSPLYTHCSRYWASWSRRVGDAEESELSTVIQECLQATTRGSCQLLMRSITSKRLFE